MGDINKIAVLYGGSSSEREISIQSGEGVYKAIIELGYITELIDINDLEDLSELKVFDFIFIALHGFEGEGGKLQEDLDDLNILYSGSNSKACRNTWNKRLTKEILEKNNIRTPVWLEVKFNKTIVDNGLRLSLFDRFRPFEYLFLKPQEDGSSVDIFKISDEESLRAAYKKCTNPNRDFLFEEYIHGREITVTIIDKECFPPIEIITKNEFYDYDAKYHSNETLLIEAKLNNRELTEINKIAFDAFKALDCNGWARVDLIQDDDGKFYVIEINTVPGMTSHSCVPKSGSFLGLSYNDVVKKIIDASS
jgi:D-alanine-D-alanine ligase